MSIFPWLAFVVPLGFLGGLIGGIANVVGGIFGSKKSTSSAQPSYAKQLADLKKEMASQLNLQAQESKKTLMYVGVGGVVLIIIMFFVMKK